MGFLYNTPGQASPGMREDEPHARRDTTILATLDQQVSEFYVEQRLSLHRQLLFLGVERAEAQELTQEAFLALYRALRSGEKVENWRA